jgi:hypothetical protein
VTGATTWHGRRGPVILGPTEHRVARWLADMTRAGRVTIRTVDLARATRVERSEAYRITRRLRILGLFGIENDQGGTRGGRRYWRTSIEHDAAELDAARHRQAWARLVAWARSQRGRLSARLAALRPHDMRAGSYRPGPSRPPTARASVEVAAAGASPPGGAGGTFADRMRRAGLGELMDAWGVR